MLLSLLLAVSTMALYISSIESVEAAAYRADKSVWVARTTMLSLSLVLSPVTAMALFVISVKGLMKDDHA